VSDGLWSDLKKWFNLGFYLELIMDEKLTVRFFDPGAAFARLRHAKPRGIKSKG